MRFISRISRFLDQPVVAVVSIAVCCAGIVELISLITSELAKLEQAGQSIWETAPLAMVVGLGLFVLILFRSGLKDFLGFFPQRRKIIAGLGHQGTPFYFLKFLDFKSEKLIITGQSLRTLLADSKFLPRIGDLLNSQREITLILTTFEAIKGINRGEAPHYRQTIQDLCNFVAGLKQSQRDRLSIHFHPGVSSLSTLIRDPHKTKRACLVFTPKFANDVEPQNRIYCAVSKREQRELFNKIYGGIDGMTQADSLGLDDMRKIISETQGG
ncbi:MAG: hypothetical protein ACYTEL_25525 [Planctomycetota bacterium]|jgi:hypothetical protein